MVAQVMPVSKRGFQQQGALYFPLKNPSPHQGILTCHGPKRLRFHPKRSFGTNPDLVKIGTPAQGFGSRPLSSGPRQQDHRRALHRRQVGPPVMAHFPTRRAVHGHPLLGVSLVVLGEPLFWLGNNHFFLGVP